MAARTLAVAAALLVASVTSSKVSSTTVLVPSQLSTTSSLIVGAAKNLRRYLHVSGHDAELGRIVAVSMPEHVTHAAAGKGHLVVLLSPMEHATTLLGSIPEGCAPKTENGYALCRDVGSSLVTVIGADEASTFYGAQTFLEEIGLRFGLENPLLPTSLTVKTIPHGFQLQQDPVFNIRGLQPFHDFFSGPDWWTEDEQKRVLEMIASMKGNFLGYHTYPIVNGSPESTGTNEPTTWIGLTSQLNPDGTVPPGAAYPTSWANTWRPEWGMTQVNTSQYWAGAASIYEYDCFGHPIQSGNASRCPIPVDAATSADIFNDVGALWQTVFAYAHKLGVKTCIGTETPLSPPPPPSDVQIPLNVYYSVSREDHFVTTTQCAECEGLYAFVGIAGYIYGGQQPGTIGLSSYYNNDLTDNMLVPDGETPPSGYGFVRVEGYALPSTSPGDPTTTPLHNYLLSKPKTDHWAVAGGMIANASAQGYNDTGVIAQVWTTGTAVTAQQYYEGTFTRLKQLFGETLDYYWVWTPEAWEWSKVTINNSLVQDVVADVTAVQAAHDAVNASFGLATCGWVVGPLGYRSYFDTVLPEGWTMSSIDMQVGNTPVDSNYTLITRHAKWDIPWLEDDPGLTAPELWLNRTLMHAHDAESYNVSGLPLIHWRTRQVSPQAEAGHAYAWNSSIQSVDFWGSWAVSQFGPTAAPAAAAVFVSIDSFNLPRPVNWVTGPGTMTADASKCDWPSVYSWVDTFTALRVNVTSDIARGVADLNTLERFDYWSQCFVYMRGVARMECDWATYNSIITTISHISDPTQRQAAARSQGFAARESLVANVTRMLWDHLSRVSSVGDLGTTSNAISQSLVNAIGNGPTQQLITLAGEALPPAAIAPTTYDPNMAPVMRVLSPRTMLATGEDLRIECFVLSLPTQAPTSVTLFIAPLGSTSYTSYNVPQVVGDGSVARQVYRISLPSGGVTASDFQWYLQASLPAPLSSSSSPYTGGPGIPAGTHVGANGVTLMWPPTAPSGPQTVVVF